MNIKKILIFNPFGIGDVLFTTPLIRNLKENLGAVSITYIANIRSYQLLKNNNLINNILVFEKDEWRAIARQSKLKFLKKAIYFFSQIKKEKFDVVFDFSFNSQYGFFLKMLGIKKRIGYNFKKRGRFLTHKIDLPQGYHDKHVVDYCLDLLKFLDITSKTYHLDLAINSDSLLHSRKLLQSNSLLNQHLIIGVCPASGDSWVKSAYFKRWPEENFLKLCEYLVKQKAASIILFGSKSESAVCEFIHDRMDKKPLNLCGKLSLEEFYTTLSLCDLVITNDGGSFHIAQALAKKILVFFGPASEKIYGPYPDEKNIVVLKKDIACRPCYRALRFNGCDFDKKCLKDISVEEAKAAVQCLLD